MCLREFYMRNISIFCSNKMFNPIIISILFLASVIIGLIANSQYTIGVQSLNNTFNIVSFNRTTENKKVIRKHPRSVKANNIVFDAENKEALTVNKGLDGGLYTDVYSSIWDEPIQNSHVNKPIAIGVYSQANRNFGIFSVQGIFNNYGYNKEICRS